MSSILSPCCTGMRTRGSSTSGPAGIAGGGGGSGSGSSAGGRGCAAAALAANTSKVASKRRIKSILLEVQQYLALLRRRLEAALLVEREDGVDHLLRLVAHLQKIELEDVDHALGGKALAHPLEQPAPERLVHQDDRHLSRLAGLHQRQRLEQLVEGAVAAGQHDVRGGHLGEHDLASEEVAKAQADVLVAIAGLLAR